MTTQEIVQKLWNLCHDLRDDGITYHQYVTELTYLLFLKMAQETGAEEVNGKAQIPARYRWSDLVAKDGVAQLEFYRGLLLHLGTHGSKRVKDIYANANTSLRQPRNLAKLVEDIDALDWYDARVEGLGDLQDAIWRESA